MAEKQHVARLVTVGFEGPSVSPELEDLIARGVGGVILFGRNVETPRQVRELVAEVKRLAARPLFVAVDQEGGAVRRFREGFTELPAMRNLGDADDERLAWQVGVLLGRELAAVGVDVNFAPVVDVDTNPDNPVIGDRALSRSAPVVARLAAQLIRGLQSEGVVACAKHFPGHGDTLQDSHLELARVGHDLERLRSVELLPFRAAIAAGVESIMTAHVVVAALDSAHPATLSDAIIRHLLREELAYDGVVFSDDLEMKAIADRYDPREAALLGVLAGVDSLLVCHTAELAHGIVDALEQALARGDLPRERVAEANRRLSSMLTWVAQRQPPGLEVLDCPEHRQVAARLARQVRDENPAHTSERGGQ